MKKHNFGTGQNIVYVDYTTTGTGASSYQSSANPINISSNMLAPDFIFAFELVDLVFQNSEKDFGRTVNNNVKKSLEKSLRENASVWDELSKL